MQSQRLALVILLLLIPALAPAVTYFGARYDQSRWESRRDGSFCRLSHPIPHFGVAVFSQSALGELSLTVYANRPPQEAGRAIVYSRNPNWKPATEQELYGARLRADDELMRLSDNSVQRLLAELEQGWQVVLRFDGWWRDGLTEVALSPVNFRPALRAHFACVAGLPQLPTTAVYFASDDAGLDLQDMDTLRRFAARLQAEPSWTAVVSGGHADPRGGTTYNRTLAQRRAQQVRDYLVAIGIALPRIQIRSFGERFPVSNTADNYGLAESRRVVLGISR